MQEDQNQVWWHLLQEEVLDQLAFYKEYSVISDFTHISNSIFANKAATFVVTMNEMVLTVDIYNTNKTAKCRCEAGRVEANCSSLLVHTGATATEVCMEIFSLFSDRIQISDKENKLTALLHPYFIVEPAKFDDDNFSGIDCYIRKPNETRRMPLQQKSASDEGLKAHALQYPTIPAIGYDDFTPAKKIQKVIRRMLRKYFEHGEIMRVKVLK